MNIRIVSILATLAISIASIAQSTAFTYQGELKSGGTNSNGPHDMRFNLFDAVSGGTQVGSTICNNNVQVSNGKFTTSIDFGQSLITASQRFVEIEVRTDSGLDCTNAGGFVVLSPRQALTPAPLATHAKSAFSLAAADGSPSNAVNVDNAGNVGIGTASPTHSVHIANTAPTLALQDTDSGTQQVGYVSYRDSANTEKAWVGFGGAGDPDFSIINARSGGDIVLNPFSGNVGIGTPTPTAKLDVRGDIRLGSSGQYRATASEENLRLVRGTIAANGTITRGSGFTVQRLDVGKYRVTFTSAFASTPAITATSTRHFGDLQVGFAAMDEFDPPTSSQATFVIRVFPANDYRDSQFDFIAVGPR